VATITTTIGPGGRWGTLPYTPACTVKSRSGLVSTPNVNRRKKREKEACRLAQAGLSSYLYRLLVTCIYLSVLRSFPPHHNMAYGKQLMGPKMNARQQRHVGPLGNTLGETQVRGSPRVHPGITPAHLCGTRRG
jgi:hypothetical protein